MIYLDQCPVWDFWGFGARPGFLKIVWHLGRMSTECVPPRAILKPKNVKIVIFEIFKKMDYVNQITQNYFSSSFFFLLSFSPFLQEFCTKFSRLNDSCEGRVSGRRTVTFCFFKKNVTIRGNFLVQQCFKRICSKI